VAPPRPSVAGLPERSQDRLRPSAEAAAEEPAAVCWVLQGRVEVRRRGPTGRPMLRQVVGAGGAFTLDGGPSASIVHRRAEVWRAPMSGLPALCVDRPLWAIELVRRLARARVEAQAMAAALAITGRRRALCQLLAHLVDTVGEPGVHGCDGDLCGLTQRSLGDLIGATRQFVCEVVRDLRRQGVLGSAVGTVCVRDRERLRALAR
jgi:CRP-like cAMP-binding protein